LVLSPFNLRPPFSFNGKTETAEAKAMQARGGCWFKLEASEQWLLASSDTVLFWEQNSSSLEHPHISHVLSADT